MKTSISLFLILGFSLPAFASSRTFTAINEKATLDLQQVQGSKNKYYARISNLDSPLAGQTVIIDRSATKSTEEFYTKGIGFSARFGGQYAKAYTTPPTAGLLIFKGRDIPLKADDRSANLESAYSESECLGASSQDEAQKALSEAEGKVKGVCGKTPKIEVNWKSFQNPARACNGREFLRSIAELCKDEDYKSALNQLTTVTIEAGEKTFEKKGSALFYRVAKEPLNTFSRAKSWLEESL
jgi:hypothetical protein